ncbi:MAG TPA: ABC transporter substrate-binding protein [Acidimicrobiales bacterium]|nr:ABC transporter substrate-binding protein [Acidimicrobiales bacterium]
MTHAIDRRSFLAGAVALGAGATLLGSGAEWAGASLTNGSGRNGISTAKPKRGGSIVFGIDTEEGGFDPTTARWDEGGYLYARCVFDPLAIINSAGVVEPFLAQSITANHDYTAWTITLRPGIVFHDGTPLNAAALLLNTQKQASSILTGPALSAMVADVVITGPLSVRVDMKAPWAPFPYYLADQQIGYIAAPSMLNNPNGTSHPVGTGPFVFGEWIPNVHFTATANPHYWRSGLPYLSKITFKPIIDPNARVNALETGTVDIIHTSSPTALLQFRGNKKWSYYDNSGAILGQPTVNCLMLNTGSAPFNNHTLRVAMAKASNSAQYSKVIDKGINAPMNGLFLPGSRYFTKTAYPSYDPKGAAKLVKQIESATGKPVSFSLNATGNSDVARAAQFVQQKFTSVGMKVSINTLAQSTLINEALAGTYQATTWRQFGAVDPDLNYVWWSSKNTKPPLALNMARNSDPRIEAAMTLGRSTTDPAIRVKAYQQVNQYLGQDIPYIYADRDTWAVIANSKVQNFANPLTVTGSKAIAFDEGVLWPAQIWVS